MSAGVTRCELGPLLPATAYQVAVYSQNTVGAAEYLHIYSIDTISTHLQYRQNIYTSTDGISTYLRIQVGLGEPAVAVSLTTQEEAPSGPPRGVRVEAVSSTQLRVTWQVRSRYSWCYVGCLSSSGFIPGQLC